MDSKTTIKYGYTTEQALNTLYEDIDNVLVEYENAFRKESYINKFKQLFAKRYDTPFSWFSIFMTFFCIISLFIIEYYSASIILFIIFLITILFVIRENILCRTELHRKIKTVLDDIADAKILCKDWTPNNYPNICSPLSPCVTLQWTYRDGAIVNLPWALLVRGDNIIIRPGQVAPGPCTEINGKHKFKSDETYGLLQPMEPPLKPTARSPLPDLICVMESTPYLENLRTSLNTFLNRPATIYNQQRYLLVTKYIQQWGVIFSLAISFIAGCLRYFQIFSKGRNNADWMEVFFEIPICAMMPILPLIFPLLWISINLWGTARLQTLLFVQQPLISSEQQKSFQEDLDTPTSFEWENAQLRTKDVFSNWLSLWYGSSELLSRSANVVQVLGSITALCCIDKKGILSWPNPTAEKVFFLRNSAQKTKMSQSSLDSETSNEGNNNNNNNNKSGTIAEVLDLTHDQHSAFKLQFDDHEWKNHINSLKPLGLAILVNTCCPMTQAHYAQFCGHVTAVAVLDKDLVPVTNRYAIVESRLNSFMHGRCLCELAKQIGFTSSARDVFNLEGQIASYMHLQPEVVKRDIRFARQLKIASKVKVPFPHCLSVVMREMPSGSLQLLTQGTADIVLDCCDDFWNGKDLQPLGVQERKRAQDFYQRNALTAYCTAFSYRPLRHGICGALGGGINGETAYLELPPESKYRMTHDEKYNYDYDCDRNLQHSISSDSLLFSDHKEEDITDVDGCFKMQCHQVFIGMVTMQYQTQSDIVQLVERLDRACIRFVHFSKENELRSRVFSEKMGLESGWNCHISLLSEDNSTLSSPKSSRHFENKSNIASNIDINTVNTDCELNRLLPQSGLESSKNLSSSAPCAISNQDSNIVFPKSSGSSSSNKSFDMEMQHRSSKDSAIMEDENCHSLSCLTDSTEQSAPVNFDMSNRAKLPRGIENIRPHLENVDNVPLLVSLFTDCSAEATREMLGIMQDYGEIVVCIGSSASNSNAEIFLQADCGIAVEPLYPQVCQDIPAYNETNILNNKLKLNSGKSDEYLIFKTKESTNNKTISPVYLSRMLNSVPCSISVYRDDALSIVALIELSRKFSNGLWCCIQFWACCGCSLAFMNTLCSCLSLPPLVTPLTIIYFMCIAVPALSITLVHVDHDSQLMNRATGKKQTKFDSTVFMFVICCYGCKFITPIIIMILSYCTFLSHPVDLLNIDDASDFLPSLEIARNHISFAIIIHFVTISISFVHRDYSIWQKNPFSNFAWFITSCILIVLHLLNYIYNIIFEMEISTRFPSIWPIILFLFGSVFISFLVAEVCKWEELKVNTRYQRRARLDFGTKLGMNSPF